MTKLLNSFSIHKASSASVILAALSKVSQHLLFASLVLLTMMQTLYSAEVSKPANNKVSDNGLNDKAPVIIQSQVKGSQEQPNVIYIMPWQGVEQIIEVQGKERTIRLPKFPPIHPQAFKEQVRFFVNQQNAAKKTKASSSN